MTHRDAHQHQLSRRSLLAFGAAATATLMVPKAVLAARQDVLPKFVDRFRRGPARTLSFYHQHTGERLTTVYWQQGRYVPDALGEINWILRDFHVGEVKKIDPALMDLLYDLRQMLGTNEPFHVVSGYRSPATNAMLARRSRQVALNSYHMKGRAIDLYLPSSRLSDLRRAASSLRYGGVGYYPRSHFVHLDTGPVRHWSGA